LLDEIEFQNADSFFHYHIYFVDKKPEEMKEKMMYISTNILDMETDVTLVNNLWGKSSFGIPDWSEELKDIRSKNSELNSRLFFSGPRNMKGDLIGECKKLKIGFNQGEF
jgi:hypothetical protein